MTIEYICEICGKSFGNNKHHLIYHQNRKYPCKAKLIITPGILQTTPKNSREKISDSEKVNGVEKIDKPVENSLECEHCGETFTRKDNLTRHINSRCKANKPDETKQIMSELVELNKQLIKQNEENNKKFDELKKQNEELKNELVEVKKAKSSKQTKKVSNTTNNTNNTTNSHNTNMTNSNNTNINIQINKYGTENYDQMDKLFLEPMIKEMGKQIFLKMIKNVYINPDLPQNHNIVVTDRNRQICKTHDGERWHTTDINIVNDLVDRIVTHSKNKHVEFVEKFKTNKKIKDRLDISKKYIDRCDQERLADLEDDREGDNKSEIARCKDFYDMVYKDTINLLHDYKDIILH